MTRSLSDQSGGHRLPGRVQRAVDRGEIADPMWYVGPEWPTLEDILDMTDAEYAEFRAAYDENQTESEAP